MKMAEQMKAAVFVAPGKIEIKNVTVPECGPKDILLKVHVCGICGSDIRNFRTGLRADVGEQILGHEFTGVVCRTGKEISRFKVGDRLAVTPDVSCGECEYCQMGLVNLCDDHRMIGLHWPGGFAEYVLLPEIILKRGIIHLIPERLSLRDAALSEPLSSVIAAQEQACVSLGDSIVIFGTGPIGCMHAEIARLRGASQVILVGRRRMEDAKIFSPDHLFSIHDENLAEKIIAATNGRGANVAVCANPSAATQEIAVESVRKRGKVLLFGGLPKDQPMTQLNSNSIHYREIMVMGTFSYRAESHIKALQTLEKNLIKPERYFRPILPLSRIEEGFNAAINGQALKPLIVIEE